MENINWRVCCTKICSNCGSHFGDFNEMLCEECGHRLILQVSTDDMKHYLDNKYAATANHNLNLKEVLSELFPKDLFDYITFASLHYLITSGLTEVRSWQDKLEDLRFFAGKTNEEKRELTAKIQALRTLLEDYSDKLQLSLQQLWKKVQTSPLKIKFEEFARVWQKSQEFLPPEKEKTEPELAKKVQEGLEGKLASVEESATSIEKAFPALKTLMTDLLAQVQAQTNIQVSQNNAQVSQGLWRSLQELQFIMSLLPQMLQGRDYPHQTVEVYNVNALMDLGGDHS